MKRPYIIINCAMSTDGKISLPNKKQLKISCDKDISRMYNLRNRCDAVLVGIGTILSDDPKLTVKKKYIKNPHQPIRIVLDSKCKTPKESKVLNKTAKTLIITNKKCRKKFGKNVEIIECKTNKIDDQIDLNVLLEILYKRGIKTLMVEGGGNVIWSFLRLRLVDDLYIYISPIIIGGNFTPTLVDGVGINNKDEIIFLKIINITKFGKGILTHYKLL